MGWIPCHLEFADHPTASDVKHGGMIMCKRSCEFTQYSKLTFGPDETLKFSCKVMQLMGSTLRFGILPVDSTEQCTQSLLGSKELRGSVGCSLEPGKVLLYRGGLRPFFNGDVDTGDPTHITMRFANGKLSFWIDGKLVNSPELSNIEFTGTRVRIGVSMTTQLQIAEIFYTCPLVFKDCWTHSEMIQEAIVVKQDGMHTVYSEDVLEQTGTYVLQFWCMKSQDSEIGIGIVPRDSHEQCRTKSVGRFPGSVACIIRPGVISVVLGRSSGEATVLVAKPASMSDPNVITMLIKDGMLSWQFNGQELDKKLKFSGNIRVGVGLRTADQLVWIRGGSFKMSGDREIDAFEGHRLQDSVALHQRTLEATGPLRFKDCMKSISLDEYDRVAVGVRKFTATLFTQRVVPAKSNESIELRILGLPEGQLMFVGVVAEAPGPHAYHHLGSGLLKNSLGVTNRGDVHLRGSTVGVGIGFQAGDLVRLAFDDGQLSVTVNGREATRELSHMSFATRFRWAVSFTDAGQAVKIGSEPLREREASFLKEMGVSNPAVSPGSQAAAVTPAAGLPGTESAWNHYFTADGRVYYHNRVTGETQWDRPGQVNTGPGPRDLPPFWVEYKAGDGRRYYHNPATNVVTWERPRRHEPPVESGSPTSVDGAFLNGHGTANDPAKQASSNGSSTTVDRDGQMLDDLVESCRRDPRDIAHDACPLAQGSFGKVYRGTYEDTEVAVKEMKWEKDENQLREIALGRLLSHPNILSIMGWARSEDQQKLLVVMPLYPKGSLADKLDSVASEVAPCPAQGGPFGWDFFFSVSIGLLRALKLMANSKPKPVVHRDIKPGNILLTNEDKSVLADFGLARGLDANLAMTMACPLKYMALEQLLGKGAGTATDVYAAALVIYEVLCAPRSCRRFENLSRVMDEVRRGIPPRMDDVPAPIAKALLPAMAADRDRRPSAADMLAKLEDARANPEGLRWGVHGQAL